MMKVSAVEKRGDFMETVIFGECGEAGFICPFRSICRKVNVVYE